MSIANDLDIFIKSNADSVFIEAEAKQSRLNNFYNKYNTKYNSNINNSTDGVIVLKKNANKWGLELRLYLHYLPPSSIGVTATKNDKYRGNYSYRINDVKIIEEMFELGYRIGLN